MRSVTLVALTCVAVATAQGQGQKKPSAEIGMAVGVTILSASGSTITSVGIPTDNGALPLFSRPAIYTTFFATPSLMIEPQLSFANVSGSGSSFTMLLLGAQVGHLFTPDRRKSAYVAANAAFQTVSASGSSASGPGLGAAIGYRFAVGKGLSLRLEGRYRRWLSDFDGINEIGIALGIAGII